MNKIKKRSTADIKGHRAPWVIHPLPMTLWVLLLLSGLWVACKREIIFGDDLGYTIENSLIAAKKKAVEAGLSSVTVDLNKFTNRKIKKICLQTYSIYGIGSREQQRQEFEKSAGESLPKASHWDTDGDRDWRIVIFFRQGDPERFSFLGRTESQIYRGNFKSICSTSSFVLLSARHEHSDWTIDWSKSQ
jgi:hypothetical protein